MGTAALPGWTKTAFGKPNLRVGILSDIHVTSDADASFFEKALRYFDARKVDAVLVTGDLFTWGSTISRKHLEPRASNGLQLRKRRRRS